MKYGKYIKAARIGAGKTQKDLADAIDKGYSTVQKYELDLATPPIDVLRKIAEVLGVQVITLMEPPKDVPDAAFWTVDLEDKLKQIGCSIGAIEAEGYLWINYPDGTLEVTEDELKELHTSSNEFMRFKLEELKKKRPQDFRPSHRPERRR